MKNNSIVSFFKGIENEEALGIRPSFSQSFSMVVFCLLLLVFGKHVSAFPGRVAFVDFCNAKRIYPADIDCQYLYHSKALRSFWDFRNKLTLVTPIPCRKRLSIAFQTLFSIFRVHSFRLVGYFAEYLLIQSFIDVTDPSFFATTATVDRRVCWICGFLEEKAGTISIFPHGTLIGLNSRFLPNRFRVDDIYCWNYFEKEMYSKGVVLNPDCRYHISLYKPSVEFQVYPVNPESLSIGIFTQKDSMRYVELVSGIKKALPDCTVVVMPHPLENIETVSRQFEGLSVRIVPNDKFINFDICITGNSTIIYDLTFSDYQGTIISYSEPNDFEKACSNVMCIEKNEDVIQYIIQFDKS